MTGSVILLVVLMALPLAALSARRLSLASWMTIALLWVAIFAGLFLIVSVWQSATDAGGVLARMVH